MRLPMLIVSAFVLTFSGLAHANNDVAKIAEVKVKRDSADQPGIFHFVVTIEHQDTGWDDYIEGWEIFDPNGLIIASRPFFEPELEKATTKTALSGVIVPEDFETVTVRARNYPNGLEGEPFEVKIPH